MALVKKISELVINASPMLQAVFQLFNTSLTLILRPIGDFIGFLLRPIMIYFLQNVAIPFYKYFTPFMQKYGTAIGEGIVTLMKWIGSGASAVTSAGSTAVKLTIDATIAAKNFLDGIGTAITKALDPKSLTDAWNTLISFFQGLDNGITPVLKFWDKFYGFFTELGGGAIATMKTIWSTFTGFFNLLSKDVNGTILNAWADVEGFFNTLLKDVTTVLQPIWTVFMKFWNAIKTFLDNVGDFIKNPLGILSSPNSPVSKTISSTEQSVQGALGIAIQNLNITGLQLGTDATMLLKDPIGYITKAIQTVNSKAVAR